MTASHEWVNRGAGRAVNAAAARYGTQADAILYLGPGELLTASRPDPATYQWGAYPVRQAVTARALPGDVAYVRLTRFVVDGVGEAVGCASQAGSTRYPTPGSVTM